MILIVRIWICFDRHNNPGYQGRTPIATPSPCMLYYPCSCIGASFTLTGITGSARSRKSLCLTFAGFAAVPTGPRVMNSVHCFSKKYADSPRVEYAYFKISNRSRCDSASVFYFLWRFPYPAPLLSFPSFPVNPWLRGTPPNTPCGSKKLRFLLPWHFANFHFVKNCSMRPKDNCNKIIYTHNKAKIQSSF